VSDVSVCPSVTTVDCDHIVQQNVEMGTLQDRPVAWPPACQRRLGSLYPVISTDERPVANVKMWSFALRQK